MTNGGDNRSVTARDITGSSIVTGDNNVVHTRMTQHTLPPPDSVDVAAELAALRDLLATLHVPQRGRLDAAMANAQEDAAKPAPDKPEIANALGQAVRYAKAADDFSQHAQALLPRIAALGSWLGAHGHALLAQCGIAT